jgi:hypothetical protein
MGGNSRWNILTDAGLSSTLPEVFASPDVLSGCLHHEVQKVFSEAESVHLGIRETRPWRASKGRHALRLVERRLSGIGTNAKGGPALKLTAYCSWPKMIPNFTNGESR